MSKCSACGYDNQEGNRYCDACGSALSAEIETPFTDAHIQSSYNNTPVANSTSVRQEYTNSTPNPVASAPTPHSTLSVIALICSFLCCFSFIGLILGIIDLVNAKNEKTPKKHTLSIIAVAVGGVMLLFSLISYATRSTDSSRETYTSELETEIEEAIEESSISTTQETTVAATTIEITESTTSVDYTIGMDSSTAGAFLAGLNYLGFSDFSRQGLIDQLSSAYADNYSVEVATAAVEAIEEYGLVDWNEQAVRCAEDYLDFTAFSRLGLIDQMTSAYGNRYTTEEASYAVDYLEENNLVDWNEQAVRSAESYLDYTAFSRLGLIDQMTSAYGEQYTTEEATYAVDYLEENNLVDWNEQAVRSAESYLSMFSFTRSELINQLTSSYGEQFTTDQATYAVNQLGL